MECPSLLDVLDFLNFETSNEKTNEMITTNNLNNTNDEENISMTSEFNKTGGSAQGDSTQMKTITLGTKSFPYYNYTPKRKSAKKYRSKK